jgi:hypothetical protein
MNRDLENLRKRLPAGPTRKPLTPTMDHLFSLMEENHRHPMQKWIDYGWLSTNGITSLTWDFWQSKGNFR